MKTLMGWVVVIGLVMGGRWWTEDWLMEREVGRMNQKVREVMGIISIHCKAGDVKAFGEPLVVWLCREENVWEAVH